MYYTQLRAFHAVALHGSFTEAAISLGLTQPTLSDQVKKLEQDFAVTLFNRVRKRTTLTETGQRLFEVADNMLDFENRAVDLLGETQSLQSGHLIIAADAPFHILQVIAKFRRIYPGVSVAVNIGNSEMVMNQLFDFRADIGVLANNPPDPRVKAFTLRDDPLVAVVPCAHPWATRGSMSFLEMRDQNLVLRERGSTTRRLVEEAFHEHGMVPHVVIEVEGRECVREAIAAGIGIGFVSKSEFGCDDRVAMVHLTGCNIFMRESIVCLESRLSTRAIAAFWDVAAS